MDQVLVWLAGELGKARWVVWDIIFAPFLSCAACISEYLSPFRFLSHALPCAVVLQENTPLIRHSAAGNYLHLFKLLFMSFV